MQILIHITNHENTINPILSKMMEEGFHGASVFDCEGMLSALNEDSVEAPDIFGSLRKFVNPDRQQNKMLMAVLQDSEVDRAIEIIHEVAGTLELPNAGILVTVPVSRWEGIINQ